MAVLHDRMTRASVGATLLPRLAVRVALEVSAQAREEEAVGDAPATGGHRADFISDIPVMTVSEDRPRPA